LHLTGDGNVLGDVEVVQAELAGNFGDEGIAVIGQSRNDRFDRMLSEILNQIGPVRGIQAEDAPILLTDALKNCPIAIAKVN
jgi:hypothetical protein